ncbi:MAG: outer membrane beta-barrel protein [Sphingobacteriales bacterium]|jgi:hypothetical protein|nr:outer membrane beta-barrel protein [Sphingobacteriales bacterium]
MRKSLMIGFLFLVPSLLFGEMKPHVFKMGARPKLQIGFQSGINIDHYVYQYKAQKDVGLGYQGGIFFRVSRQKVFAQFELNYLWSQVHINSDALTGTIGQNIPIGHLTMRYHTFGIPFIFGAIPVKKPIFKWRIYNGIEADFIMKAHAVLYQQNSKEVYKLKLNEKRAILRPEQFSYQLGTGMDIAMFIFDFKYNLGFRSFYKEVFRTQTHMFQMTAGVIF